MISAANRWQSLAMALTKSKGRASGIFGQANPSNNVTPNEEEVKRVRMDFGRFLDLRPRPADGGKCGALRMSDVCEFSIRPTSLKVGS